jgi:hypothetical protein
MIDQSEEWKHRLFVALQDIQTPVSPVCQCIVAKLIKNKCVRSFKNKYIKTIHEKLHEMKCKRREQLTYCQAN